MKNTLLYIIGVIITFSLLAITSCSQEEMMGFEDNGPHTCKLIFK
jgi:hypothetical protein